MDSTIENDVQQIYLDLAWRSTNDRELFRAEMDSNCATGSIQGHPKITVTAPLDEFAHGLQQLLALQNWSHIVLIVDHIFGNLIHIYNERKCLSDAID